MEWTDDAVANLRAMAAEGLSYGEISRRTGISKNAIVGKANRLGLPSRPSPIKPAKPKRRTPTPAERHAAARAAIGLT